jgi:hypothetical protein
MQTAVKVALVTVVSVILLPGAGFAQEGQIAGTVRDTSGGVMPGVLVEVTSPALIEKVRSTVSDDNGQYRITSLPVGTYTVNFTLTGFARQQRDNIVLTTGFTAPVNATMTVGGLAETISVTGESPVVDVQNARQVATFDGEEIRELPTARNIRSLLTLTPGLTAAGLGADCVGGAGVWCNNNIYNLNAHTAPTDDAALTQGRIMVDGTVINSTGAGIMGMTGGYTADVANAAEVTVQTSGALGESETGGASINIIPRTGGNQFNGTGFVSYTRQAWFGTNNGTHTSVQVVNSLIDDHDLSGSFGGPIKRDRLWFYATARAWGKEAYNGQGLLLWNNKNAGQWGANYQPDRSQDPLTFTNLTRNANVRVTYQMSQRNKFNFFWDEGLTCQDPCDGSVASWAPPEGTWSGQVHPVRLNQVSWTSPFTNNLLLEAGFNLNTQLYDFSHHRYVEGHKNLPRILEIGETVGMDEVAPRVNSFAGAPTAAVPSAALNNGLGGAAESRDLKNLRTRASVSYVTGSHNAKLGYDGGYFSQFRHNTVNDLRLTYRYDWPAATCAATATCGNTSLYFPLNPTNIPLGPDGVAGTVDDGRRPVPSRVTINTGLGELGTKVQYSAFYLQDQWTLNRVTLSGAVRYDHATSRYLETCIGPDPYVPVQVGGQHAGQNHYCTPPSDGVSFNNITPRWAVTWDVFGTGRTALKWNMGKYLNAANIGGIYSDANPAARAVNELERGWHDDDGDRIVDCDLLNFNPNGECELPIAGQDPVRYGRDPLSLDAAGTPIGLATTQCGRREQGIPAAVQDYCNVYGDTLLEGWGKRRNEWQFGIGIQHEILPRLSAEVTYNRTKHFNLTVTDQLGVGCDRFNGTQDLQTCVDGNLNYTSQTFDFFTYQVPADPRLPGGGGYLVRGLANPKPTLATGQPSAVTIAEELEYTWSGVDTNFVWRAPGGLRVNGGTSTGRALRDLCYAEFEVAFPGSSIRGPNVKSRDGNTPACNPRTRFDTTVRGSAAYTVPKIDVLVSSVFQYRPGVELNANLVVSKDQVQWEPDSAFRAAQPCTGANAGLVGCFVPVGNATTATTTSINLLDPGDLYSEGYTIIDLKLSKNIRFASRRLNVGVDIYNLFNDDAIRGINQTYTIDNPSTPAVEVNNWGQPTTLLSPRFARLQVQVDF